MLRYSGRFLVKLERLFVLGHERCCFATACSSSGGAIDIKDLRGPLVACRSPSESL